MCVTSALHCKIQVHGLLQIYSLQFSFHYQINLSFKQGGVSMNKRLGRFIVGMTVSIMFFGIGLLGWAEAEVPTE